jgi:RNA polymerase sigma-70 factor (ECF subfamily)
MRIALNDNVKVDLNRFRRNIQTRQSLLSKLKNWTDQESWKTFFDTYWRLIYSTAINAGLTPTEAEDVVQDTVISVMKGLPDYRRRNKKRLFRNWLLRRTTWRIGDQLRKKQRGLVQLDEPKSTRTSTETGAIEKIDSNAGLEKIWNDEWEENLLEAAIDRVKRKVNPKDYQLFDLVVVKERPVSKVAKTLAVSRGRIYLAKHRISRLIRKEVDYLKTKQF